MTASCRVAGHNSFPMLNMLGPVHFDMLDQIVLGTAACALLLSALPDFLSINRRWRPAEGDSQRLRRTTNVPILVAGSFFIRYLQISDIAKTSLVGVVVGTAFVLAVFEFARWYRDLTRRESSTNPK